VACRQAVKKEVQGMGLIFFLMRGGLRRPRMLGGSKEWPAGSWHVRVWTQQRFYFLFWNSNRQMASLHWLKFGGTCLHWPKPSDKSDISLQKTPAGVEGGFRGFFSGC
jgi:hypothetical protein